MEIHCKYCNSRHIIKKGTNYGKQVYYCKDCKKYFRIGDNRIKRNAKQKEMALLLYYHNISMRSIQNIINKYFDTTISFNVINNWVETSINLSKYDTEKRNKKEKSITIETLELDELYTYFSDLRKNRKNMLKYGLVLIEDKIKLFQVK
jgi:transposase-like protein